MHLWTNTKETKESNWKESKKLKDLIMKSVMFKINNIAKFEAEDELGSRKNNKN